MSSMISDETIEYIGILAKLELLDAEKEKAKKDMERMIEYVDILNQLDTDNVEPMTHLFDSDNVFRDDIEHRDSDNEGMLLNAPERKDDLFVVAKTIK